MTGNARFVAQFHREYACWVIDGEFVTEDEWRDRLNAWLADRDARVDSAPPVV